jgi:hypothetical protein
MAVNTLEYAVLYQTRLDEQFNQESTTAWMEGNAGLVKYEGGNTVKVPKRSVTGLGNYSRTSGYPSGGAVTLSWETFTFTQDRAQTFNLDRMDVDETNFLIVAGDVLKQFQTEQVIPEIDSYRYSKIFQLSNQKLKTGAYTPAAGTIYSQLIGEIKTMQDTIGNNVSLVVMMSMPAAAILAKSTEISKQVLVSDQNFSNGNINTKVKMLDGTIPIIEVPSARLKTVYDFDATAGFSVGTNAMQINWIIMARVAPLAITKSEKPKIIDPDANQTYDGWSIFYRRYHDIWVFDNKFNGVFVNYTPISAPALTATVAAGAAAGTKFTATAGTGNSLAYKLTVGDAAAPNYNDVPTGLTAYTSGADISAAVATNRLHMYVLDATGHVLKYAVATLAAGDIHA